MTAKAMPKQARSILVVDDEPQILDALEDLLEDEFVVLTASRGEDALEMLKTHDFCVVISDQRMPGMTGDELMKRVRDESEAVRVMITGYTDMEALVKAVNNGQIYAYVAKPWQAENLKQLVGKAADYHELLRHCQTQTELLDRLMEESPDEIYFKDLEGRFIRANRAFVNSIGLDESIELEGRTEFELGGEGAEARAWEDHRVLTGHEKIVNSLMRVQDLDGNVTWSSKTKLPLVEMGMVGIIRDITQVKEAERKLRAHARQQQALAELARAALAGLEIEPLIERVVEAVANTLKVDCCAQFVPEVDGTMRLVSGIGFPDLGEGEIVSSAFLGRVLSSKETQVVHLSAGDTPLSDPVIRLGAVSAAAFPVMNGDQVWGVLKVVSLSPRRFADQELRFLETVASLLSLNVRKRRAELELQESQRRLLQAQKLEALGQMAGGVAHDFNNVLTIVRGNAELLPPGEESEQILKAAGMASELIGQLMSFARNRPVEPRVIELNQVVASDENLLRRLLGVGVDLAVSLDPRPAVAKIDPGQLTRILANLVVNARDAIEGEGRIDIEVFHPERQESTVGIRVRDTGAGMSQSLMDKIFEPFFTTKPVGKGTGLGLATAYGIVSQAGGALEVESRPGEGTTFSIVLPRHEGEESVEDPVVGGSMRSGPLTIIVVDDETAVARLISRILKAAGHEVLATSSTEEALELAATSPVDLLISDLVMPGMRGTELAEKVRQIHPRLKVILTSGYSESGLGPQENPCRFLSKPFTATQLRRLVDETLLE